MASACAKELRNVIARQLTGIQDGFKKPSSLVRERIGTTFFFNSKQNTVSQSIRLHKLFHVLHLIKAVFQSVKGRILSAAR